MPHYFVNVVDLEGRLVGQGCPTFVIAEIGVNHNGDFDTALKMVDEAARCGVDSVKFQTFRAEEFMADREIDFVYEVNGRPVSENMYDMFKRLELPDSWHSKLFDHARSRGLVPLTSTADVESVALVSGLGVSALKMASEDFINLPLLNHAAATGVPLILSTGMASEDEIDDVLELLAAHNRSEVIFLHCVSLYPTPDQEAHLQRLSALRLKTDAIVGYSDHTLGVEASCAAVALGACVVEKHFTLDRSMNGPDHALSAEPEELAALVRSIRRTESMLGERSLDYSPGETRSRHDFRRSVVGADNLEKGTVLKREHLAFKRPGLGLRARDIPRLLGGKLKRNVMANERLSLNDVTHEAGE